VERRFSAALAILGAVVAPIIHLSVRRWRGQHPTVITGEGGGLDPEMKVVFAVALVAFTLFFLALLYRRFRFEQGRRRLAALVEEAVAEGVEPGGAE
jgi:heme exporter protein C